MSLDVSPDGRTIAFDLLNDIYVLPAAGGEAKPVHTGAAVQRSPQFSPDGTQLLYLSDESGADNLWISALDGSNPRQVSKESLAMITGPAWAPDGKSLIATRTSATVFEMKHFGDSSLLARDRRRRADRRAAEERQGSAGSAPFARRALSLLHRASRRRALRLRQHRPRQLRHPSQGAADRPERRSHRRLRQRHDCRKCRRMAARSHSSAACRRRPCCFVTTSSRGTQHPVYQELDRDLQGDYIPQEHYYPAFDWFPDNRHVAIWGKGQLLRVDMHSGEARADSVPGNGETSHPCRDPSATGRCAGAGRCQSPAASSTRTAQQRDRFSCSRQTLAPGLRRQASAATADVLDARRERTRLVAGRPPDRVRRVER